MEVDDRGERKWEFEGVRSESGGIWGVLVFLLSIRHRKVIILGP